VPNDLDVVGMTRCHVEGERALQGRTVGQLAKADPACAEGVASPHQASDIHPHELLI
jgi:hypothetical protein